jgi:hypothetical protein
MPKAVRKIQQQRVFLTGCANPVGARRLIVTSQDKEASWTCARCCGKSKIFPRKESCFWTSLRFWGTARPSPRRGHDGRPLRDACPTKIVAAEARGFISARPWPTRCASASCPCASRKTALQDPVRDLRPGIRHGHPVYARGRRPSRGEVLVVDDTSGHGRDLKACSSWWSPSGPRSRAWASWSNSIF